MLVVAEEPSELTALLTQSRQCRHSHNPILVIDGGSTGTRGALFRVTSKSCPRVGRKVLPESIVFLEEGTKYAGLRQTMEKWLDENAGNDWASHPYDAKALLTKYPSMLKAGRELMHNILDNVAEMIKNHFNLYDQEDSKAVGVPVLFFSTAGVRDTHDWYRRGLFAAFMIAINSYTGPHGFNFFTNEEWTRPIPGMEEGMLAFTAANFLLGNFQKMQSLKQRIEDADTPEREKKELEKEMRSSLISIVEMGGASAQVVFPVFNVGSSPSFVNTLNLVGANYLSSDYPSVDILSASYMQLGASSATGIFYKAFCSSPENLIGGVCHNPCLPENFKQDCSTGEVKIEPDGRVNVATSIQKQRVKPAAYYCTSSNDEISKKALNRLSCLAAGINPDEPLEKRLAIENCEEMKGTGNFEACKNAVSAILLDPQLPLPANQEASYTGFDTIGQIFDFLSTSTNVVITGMALVAPIRELQKLGLLSDDYSGDVCALKEAAMRYCAAPVVLSEKNQLVRRVEVKGKTKDVPLTNYNLENCLKLGLSHGLLTLLHKSKIHPSNIQFAIDIVDPKTGKKVAEYGWPPGAILRAILDVETWARDAYILGVNHTVRDRWNATHPKGEHAVEE